MTSRFSNGNQPDLDDLTTGEAPGFADFDGERDIPRAGFSVPPQQSPVLEESGEAPPFIDAPHAIYVPENYEENYAYPLVVWLHGAGGSERQLGTLMPDISTRNYFGVSFRGTLSADELLPGGFRWSMTQNDREVFEETLYHVVCRLRREYHIHSERIYLAGFAEGATLALSVLLNRPEWLAGAIVLGGKFPESDNALAQFRDLREKRVLIAAGNRDQTVSVAETVKTGRLLHATGMEVSTRIYDGAHEVTDELLDDIDHWLMQGIWTAAVA